MMARMNASGDIPSTEQTSVSEETGGRVNAQPATPESADPVAALGGRAETLLRRLRDIERALVVQEWWLLGRVLPEARVLAEVCSLLAVARGELESALVNYFNLDSAQAGQTDQFAAVEGTPGDTDDAAWVATCRDQAVGLLHMVAAALVPMLQYAQMLHTYAEHLGLHSGVVDAFGIVHDRLMELDEALRQPPE